MKITGSDMSGSKGALLRETHSGSVNTRSTEPKRAPSLPVTANPKVQALPKQDVSAPQSIAARPSIFATLGLPADKLSQALVSFVKYFSLPLDPALLAKLRRDVLSAQASANAAHNTVSGAEKNAGQPGEAPSPKQETAAFREALSLAAAAAADKRVSLSPQSLENYARSLTGQPLAGQLEVDPDGSNGSGYRHDGYKPDNNGTGSGETGGKAGTETGDNDKESGSSNELKKKITEIAEENSLLNLLNRLPGKNGQRWIVFPFSFTEKNIEYKVSLRILLQETPLKTRADVLALDIFGGERRRSFILDRAGDSFSRLELSVWPPEKKRALDSMQRTLAGVFQLQPKQIIVKNDAEFHSFTADSSDELLPYINKEV